MKQDSSPAQAHPRRFQRSPMEAPIVCLRDKGLCFETAVEISEGGLLMLVQHDYKIGEIFDLRFYIPGHTPIALRGEIVYALEAIPGATYAGIRFLETPATLAPSVRSYMAKAAG